MQHIDFAACTDANGVKCQIEKLVQTGFITAQQAKLVHPEKLAAFFLSEFGRKLRGSTNVLREFKFSILEDAGQFAPDISDEQVLLQGVVDCALIETDGITVVDFKTDRVNEQTVRQSVENYRPQVETYARALSRIFELPVKAKALYFFAMDAYVWL